MHNHAYATRIIHVTIFFLLMWYVRAGMVNTQFLHTQLLNSSSPAFMHTTDKYKFLTRLNLDSKTNETKFIDTHITHNVKADTKMDAKLR